MALDIAAAEPRSGVRNVAPGASPWMKMASGSQPRKGARFHRLLYIFRPSGLGIQRNRFTRAGARGYILTPLRGSDTPQFHAPYNGEIDSGRIRATDFCPPRGRESVAR